MKLPINLLLAILISSAGLLGQQHKLTGINQRLTAEKSKIVEFSAKQNPDWSKKLSPNLRMLISQIEKEKNNQTYKAESIIKNNPQLQLGLTDGNKITISVFIKTNNTSKTLMNIASDIGYVNKITANILAGEIDAASLKYLAESDEVEFIEASSIRKPLLDKSWTETKVNQVHSGTGLPQAYKGEGVVVGVLDSGVDWEHEDFYNAQGSRIKYLWDMSASSNPPSGYNYGREYTKALIDADQCYATDSDDGHGHGTHVASTAAGNGRTNSIYTGMAPESDIVFVKGFRSGPGFSDVDVVNGCNYIFSKAQSLGKPAVINLSLGGHFGAHDGTSLYEQSLSSLTGPGKIIVAAAGNEGNDFIHLNYATSGSSINEANQTLWVIPSESSNSVVDLWYNSGNISVGVAAYDAQLNLIGSTNPISPGNYLDELSFTVNNVTYGVISIDATTTADPNNGAKRILIQIADGNGQYDLSQVYWSLYTFGSGTLDAWIITDGYFTTDSAPQNGIYPGDNNRTIGMPATAQKIISVGSYVTKTQWVDIDGNTWMQGGDPVLKTNSSFSSVGPSRDGRLKPDISAPGEVIVAALSNDLTISNEATPRAFIVSGGKYQKMQGTSMASPHVTGAIALMLQKNPLLDYDQVFSIVTSSAVKDSYTGSNANYFYGYGKLDALAAIKNTTSGGTAQVTILEEGFDNEFPPANWQVSTTNQNYTWQQGNPTDNNFNTINPASVNSAICPWVAENQNEWIVTPTLPLGLNSILEFYTGYSTNWLSSATISLLISTDGTNFNQIWTAEDDDQPWVWRSKSIDLSAYNNQNVKLAWRYYGNDGDLVGLDNVLIVSDKTTDINEDEKQIPVQFALQQNYPNPFNPNTSIEYSVMSNDLVTIKIYDVLGSEVAILVNEIKNPGNYKINFDARNLSSGVYLYRIISGNFIDTKKMILLK